MRHVALWVVGGLLVVALMLAAFFVTTEFRKSTANYRGDASQIEQVQANADFRIQSYEWFFDNCAAIQTAEARIKIQEAELETADDDRADRIVTNVVALQNQRVGLVNTYNQEARKEETTGQFRAVGLPSYINPTSTNTECGE